MPRHDLTPLLAAAVPVGGEKSARRRSAEQKSAQNAGVDQGRPLRRHGLVVEVVVTVEVDAADARQRRIVVDRDEGRHDRLADLLGEGLPLLLVLLPVPLDAVAEDLVEEHAGGPPLEDGRPDVGIGQRRVPQRLEVGDHRVGGLEHLLLAGQGLERRGVEALEAIELHAVVGARVGLQEHAHVVPSGLNQRAFGVQHPARQADHLQRHLRIQNVGVPLNRAEIARIFFSQAGTSTSIEAGLPRY